MEGEPRYDKREKLRRNALLRGYHYEHPELSFRALGEIFGITKQRAWELTHNGARNGKVKFTTH